MNQLPLWAEMITSVLLVLAGIFTLLGAIGLVCFDNFYTRIHAPTLGNSLGVILVMCASMTVSFLWGDRVFFHEIIVVIFLFLTSPITSILLMRSYILRNERMGNN